MEAILQTGGDLVTNNIGLGGAVIPNTAAKKGTNSKQKNKSKIAASPETPVTAKSWTPSTVAGRWCGLGPYYAMFPVGFAREVVESYCPPGGVVADPFCGRGTVPFVAMATERQAVGCDINPVAWVYAKVKTDPHPDKGDVLERAKQIREAICSDDHIAENEFQEYAWSSSVLGYLNAARRLLDWRGSSIDRTLMATLLVHLHAKLGDGFSNQMRQSKSMAPLYSVKWWKARGMLPPVVDVIEFISARLAWRYAKGIVPVTGNRPQIELEDGRTAIAALADDFAANLIFTSPPYCGVTNYRYDNWIRLWLLGEGPAIANGNTKQRYVNKIEYQKLLSETFAACSRKSSEDATIYVRTDAREFTLQATITALHEAWPNKSFFVTPSKFGKATQTALYGDAGSKPGEMDLLLLPQGRKAPDKFMPLHVTGNAGLVKL
ncbi:MAG: site-specific DNA-methyltransferase [Sterolibacteriaceae bacterium MAG5]|nr:site-specific DNA-methyltransferase [Candidatus Nitricoxidireducens bremensis]